MGALDDIRAGEIGGARFGRVELVEETGSTNSDVDERARAGEDEGLVLVAGAQTSGRGRLGRSWLGQPGGSILCSVLVRPGLDASHASLLTAAAGLAARDAIREITGLSVELKWPNDLMASGRKLGGILTESVLNGDAVEFCVVGMGLNVNWSREAIPAEIADIATSISTELGRAVDRGAVLERFLREFEGYVELAERDQTHLIRRYKEGCSTIGRRVSVATASKAIEGVATGIDAHGRLLVSTDDEQIVAIDAGDVSEFRDA